MEVVGDGFIDYLDANYDGDRGLARYDRVSLVVGEAILVVMCECDAKYAEQKNDTDLPAFHLVQYPLCCSGSPPRHES